MEKVKRGAKKQFRSKALTIISYCHHTAVTQQALLYSLRPAAIQQKAAVCIAVSFLAQ